MDEQEKPKKRRGNPDKLIPMNKRSPEDVKRIQRMGTEAAKAARNARRSFQEAVRAMLDQPLPKNIAKDGDIRQLIDRSNPSVLDAVVASVLSRAIAGDKQAVEACKLILAQIGEDTPEKAEIRVIAGDPEVEKFMG